MCLKIASAVIFAASGLLLAQSPEQAPANFAVEQNQALQVEHADCAFFGPEKEKFLTGLAVPRDRFLLSNLTGQVTGMLGGAPAAANGSASLPIVPGGSRTNADQKTIPANLIDKYLFAAMSAAGVTPAAKTTDFEFIRRVTLDLTGRIPAPDRVISFVSDPNPTKRAVLIEELLAKPEFIDKWTVYLGDKLKNAQNLPSSGVSRYSEGRNAFYTYIKDAVATNKPYDQIAREVISSQGDNSFDPAQGQINWYPGGIVNGGPVQDVFDQQTANIGETFLGLGNLNCVLCHNGRGHLDQLNLWGAHTTRYQAWQMASFVSHTWTRSVPYLVNGVAVPNYRYYTVTDDTNYKNDYALNTTTGNRPARQPVSPSEKAIAPAYIFSGHTPAKGQNYRTFLANEVTADPQFARAAVNYLWKEFFGRGIVTPENQFDLARLDPKNPPPAPWTLQPSNPELLDALAQDFAANGFDMKHLMKLIASSNAYQLSSRYNGTWKAEWEPLFARKLVRRLWAEEIVDNIAQSSNIPTSYNVNGFGKFAWAMQAPEPNVIANSFISAFLPGNRDDQERRSEGAVQQALNLMNDNTVMSRVKSTAATGLLGRALAGTTDEQLISTLFLNVLSRYPTDAEKSAALANLKSGDRTQKSIDLLWSLYNKVDFIFNY